MELIKKLEPESKILENIASRLKAIKTVNLKTIRGILKNMDKNIDIVVCGPYHNNTQFIVYFDKQSKLVITIEDNKLYSLKYIKSLYC